MEKLKSSKTQMNVNLAPSGKDNEKHNDMCFSKRDCKTIQKRNNPMCLKEKKLKHFIQVIRSNEDTNLGEQLR